MEDKDAIIEITSLIDYGITCLRNKILIGIMILSASDTESFVMCEYWRGEQIGEG